MIQLKQLSFSRGSKQLLKDADLTIHAGQKVGIIGANGSGKTSLLALLRGELNADDGELNQQLSLAYLAQDIPQENIPALDYVLQGDTLFTEVQTALQIAEKNHDGMAIAELHMRLGEIDGYTIPSTAAKILHGLGFGMDEITQPLTAFSGGWQMRLNLARLLLSRADILLLDEPTNHLDMEAIVWLEDWLRSCTQTILLISHDREFIDHVVTHIAHLYHRQLKIYPGNYSDFEKQRAEQLAVQQASFEKQQAQRQHLQAFIDRFRYKASKATQAQSRLKMLARMQEVLPVQIENPFSFSFKPTQAAGNPMITLENLRLGYGDKTILKGINCSIRQNDRIGLIGQNGAGKSTFIKLLAQELQPLSGMVHSNQKIKLGYFAQHQLDLLESESNPINHLLDIDKSITEGQARRYLGSFAFSNDDVFRPVGTFSGGEKARLVLALIIWQAPNLLLLDEPTNHLDLEMREALNLALQDYSGALIIVSHDRYLLNCVTNELWLVANNTVQTFKGDLNDYQQWVLEQEKIPAITEKTETSEAPIEKKPPISKQKIQKLEESIQQHEIKLKELDTALNDKQLYHESNKTKLQDLLTQREKISQKMQKLEEELLKFYED